MYKKKFRKNKNWGKLYHLFRDIFLRWKIPKTGKYGHSNGHAVVEVGSRAACGVCGGQSSTGAGFLQVPRFPLPIIIPPTSPL
jgi:hypothetical protein